MKEFPEIVQSELRPNEKVSGNDSISISVSFAFLYKYGFYNRFPIIPNVT